MIRTQIAMPMTSDRVRQDGNGFLGRVHVWAPYHTSSPPS
jgi:hypothetical protein